MDYCPRCERIGQPMMEIANNGAANWEKVCLRCGYLALQGPRPEVVAAPEAPEIKRGQECFISAHKTFQDASMRADKVFAYLRQRPIVDYSEGLHRVVGDSPLVPGFVGVNEYETKKK